MNELNVFVSVGGTATEQQESFVRAVEERLRSEGLIPHTVGRNAFSVDSPLKTVTELLDKCSGTVVIALERMYFPNGVERRGGLKEFYVLDVKLATTWNQIEGAMAYSRGHPLMVIVETGVKNEGLLERGYDWYVQSVPVDPSILASPEFNGVLSSWKNKLTQPSKKTSLAKNPDELRIGEIINNMKPAHLRGTLATIAVLVVGSFALGAKFFAG
ncbi:hypothetical protein [Pseudomonas syringae]|uniref:hypothetical protein n=1 Tax=Pseudomonas syringae TaxID=317 RepID=UPI001F2AB307|nr:hypothetical protein [Pseudomonas syringae]MCF5590019.1 hypothetical protein [Pseudomonas syringae]